jgi:hypothetical protein
MYLAYEREHEPAFFSLAKTPMSPVTFFGATIDGVDDERLLATMAPPVG